MKKARSPGHVPPSSIFVNIRPILWPTKTVSNISKKLDERFLMVARDARAPFVASLLFVSPQILGQDDGRVKPEQPLFAAVTRLPLDRDLTQ